MLRVILRVGIHDVDGTILRTVLDDLEIQKEDLEVQYLGKYKLKWVCRVFL